MKALIISVLLAMSSAGGIGGLSYLRSEEKAGYEVQVELQLQQITMLKAKLDSAHCASEEVTAELAEIKSNLIVHPFGGRAGKSYPTSPFGMRYHPTYNRMQMHAGTDLAHKDGIGTPIHSVKDGHVIYAEKLKGMAGLTVKVDHLDGTMAQYLHLNDLQVQKGDTIVRGTVVGGMGKAGTAPHLHIEWLVWNERTKVFDKKDFLEENRVLYASDTSPSVASL